MVGIKNYGIYIPTYLLERKAISKAWDFPKVPGTKSVANYDEDSISMAVEAAFNCIDDFDPKQIDGLYFASTTPPFVEKQNASFIATVLDMREDIQTADYTNSTGAGTRALRDAYNTIKAGNAKNILIVVSDRRNPEPQSMDEFLYGDGAAADPSVDGDIKVYKGNSDVEVTAPTGITQDRTFDTTTGVHSCEIDLSANLSFYEKGYERSVHLVS